MAGALALLLGLAACQVAPPTREQRVQIRETVGGFQRAVNARSYPQLSALLAPEVQVAGLPPEMSVEGLKRGLVWLDQPIGETQLLSTTRNPDGVDARVALYSRGRVMVLRMGFDDRGKIRLIESDPLWATPRPEMPATFTSDFVAVGNLMFVKGSVNGRSGYFLFDTGASGLLLNAKYFKAQPGDGVPTGIAGSVSGIRRRLGRAEVQSLQWGGLKMGGVTGELREFSLLEKPAIAPLLGAISYEEVKDCAVSIDWRTRKIQIFATNADGSKKVRAGGPAPDVSFSFPMFSHVPMIKVGIGEKEYSLLLDTGAETNMLPDKLALDGHFKPQGLVKISDGTAASGSTGLAGVVKEVSLGDAVFRNVPFTIYRTPYLSNKGFLGAPLLQQGRWEINFRSRQISIWR